jgi:hypothetical protein
MDALLGHSEALRCATCRGRENQNQGYKIIHVFLAVAMAPATLFTVQAYFDVLPYLQRRLEGSDYSTRVKIRQGNINCVPEPRNGYCTRRSKAPRGDLFEQLPVYKKFHPDKQVRRDMDKFRSATYKCHDRFLISRR